MTKPSQHRKKYVFLNLTGLGTFCKTQIWLFNLQLVIEAELGISRNSRVAVDDVIVKLYSYTNQQREKVTGKNFRDLLNFSNCTHTKNIIEDWS